MKTLKKAIVKHVISVYTDEIVEVGKHLIDIYRIVSKILPSEVKVRLNQYVKEKENKG